MIVKKTLVSNYVNAVMMRIVSFNLQENLEGQLNKRSTQKKFKSAKKDMDSAKIFNEHMESLGVTQPSVWNLLPFTMVKFG